MTLEPINPYFLIEQLSKEVGELKKENAELKQQISDMEAEADE